MQIIHASPIVPDCETIVPVLFDTINIDTINIDALDISRRFRVKYSI